MMAVGEPRICQCGGVIGWQRPQQELVATGPQVPEAPPNPETDGLVTVELTREEAEKLEAFIDDAHPSTATGRARAKLRASLERTGK